MEALLLPLLLPDLNPYAETGIFAEKTIKKRRRKRKTLHNNPTCPWCKGNNVAHTGTHTINMKKYDCKKELDDEDKEVGCGKAWQQIPPEMLKPGQDPCIQECRKRDVKAGGYKCTLCQQFKTYKDPLTGKKISHDCRKRRTKLRK